MSQGETLPVGKRVGGCETLEYLVLSMSGCVPITSAFSQSIPCSMFCVYKREGFLIYSQIILVMAQICNKSHQCYLDVFTLCVIVCDCLPGTSYTRASVSKTRKRFSMRDTHQSHLNHTLPVFGFHLCPRSPRTVAQSKTVL